MDPNKALEDLLALAVECAHGDDRTEREEELACQILALDGWIRCGGFLPRCWQPNYDSERESR